VCVCVCEDVWPVNTATHTAFHVYCSERPGILGVAICYGPEIHTFDY